MLLRRLRDALANPVLPNRLYWLHNEVQAALAKSPPAPAAFSLLGTLPSSSDTRPIILACCDQGYYERFAPRLIHSHWKCTSQSARLHLHVYGAPASMIDGAKKQFEAFGDWLTLTRDDGRHNAYSHPSAYYFAATRFIVASAMAQIVRQPIMTIDMDCMIRRDLGPALESLQGVDVGFYRRKRWKPWRKILACANYFGDTDSARLFLLRLASGMDATLKFRPSYHIDQTMIWMMLNAYERKQEPLAAHDLDHSWADYKFTTDGLIWTAKGPRKNKMQDLTDQERQDIGFG